MYVYIYILYIILKELKLKIIPYRLPQSNIGYETTHMQSSFTLDMTQI